MIRVLLDLNVLGRGLGGEVSRAGIFRVTEALTRTMFDRTDIDVFATAEASWASELLLLAYDRATGSRLSSRIVRAWHQPRPDWEGHDRALPVAADRALSATPVETTVMVKSLGAPMAT